MNLRFSTGLFPTPSANKFAYLRFSTVLRVHPIGRLSTLEHGVSFFDEGLGAFEVVFGLEEEGEELFGVFLHAAGIVHGFVDGAFDGDLGEGGALHEFLGHGTGFVHECVERNDVSNQSNALGFGGVDEFSGEH